MKKGCRNSADNHKDPTEIVRKALFPKDIESVVEPKIEGVAYPNESQESGKNYGEEWRSVKKRSGIEWEVSY